MGLKFVCMALLYSVQTPGEGPCSKQRNMTSHCYSWIGKNNQKKKKSRKWISNHSSYFMEVQIFTAGHLHMVPSNDIKTQSACKERIMRKHTMSNKIPITVNIT